MLVILLGPPGAGKGTQAERLVKEHDLPYVATGDIFRKAVREKTAFGLEAKEYMEQGLLVPDHLVVKIILERLSEPDCQKGALLDGFPRTLEQAVALEDELAKKNKNIDLVLFIDVNKKELIERLTGRRVCRDCGANYHVHFKPPNVRNVCDQCGGELYQREDDTYETVVERLNVYREQTEPVIDYYRDKGILTPVDGNRDIDAVFKLASAAIENM